MTDRATESDSARVPSGIVRPELTEKQARDLLVYTESSLAADDNYDEMSLCLEAACEALREVLDS